MNSLQPSSAVFRICIRFYENPDPNPEPAQNINASSDPVSIGNTDPVKDLRLSNSDPGSSQYKYKVSDLFVGKNHEEINKYEHFSFFEHPMLVENIYRIYFKLAEFFFVAFLF